MDITDDFTSNPIFADRGPIQRLPSYGSPEKPKPRKVPPAITRIVGELGLRYRPSVQADLEAHAETLRLLALDLLDVPPELLERAARKWATAKPWMPKASELIELARSEQQSAFQSRGDGRARLQQHCDMLNAMRWVQASGKPYFVAHDEQRGFFVERVA